MRLELPVKLVRATQRTVGNVVQIEGCRQHSVEAGARDLLHLLLIRKANFHQMLKLNHNSLQQCPCACTYLPVATFPNIDDGILGNLGTVVYRYADS